MSTTCQRPGCEGSYEDMGGGEMYCDTCGLAPVVSPNGMIAATTTGVAGGGKASRGSRGAPGSDKGGNNGGSGTGSASGSVRSSSRASSQASRSSRSATSRRSVSGRLSRSLSGATTSRSVSVRSSGTSTAASGRNRLGAGLVSVPEVPRPDPRQAIMANPEVPERKRYCSRSECGAAVGRSRGERIGRTEGFCTKCGNPYSFVPKLGEGDVVHGQYEVAGCLAHGGLGWVYLAVDKAVSDRWVVLKGLLDTGDQDAMAAAISERRFLAEIEHSNIVRIYNFVEHLDTRTGSLDGYIVMEYVGGKSLKEIANERRDTGGKRDPLPVEQACAYGIEALEALGHLHSRNLLYCDFKVDNAIQQQDQLKLIDMGAVRRMDDDESAIYGTVGYQAPEVAEVGPSVASDLYTVARTLAVLTFDFQGYTNVFADSLPDPDNIPVFRQYESFYRLLVRATDPDPARRFASASEMADQLTGVLREVVALQTGRPRPSLSTLFGPELRVTDTGLFAELSGSVSQLGVRALPVPRRTRRANGKAGKVPAALARAGQPQAGQSLAGPAPAGQAQIGQAPIGQARTGQAPAGQAPAQLHAGQPPAVPPHAGQPQIPAQGQPPGQAPGGLPAGQLAGAPTHLQQPGGGGAAAYATTQGALQFPPAPAAAPPTPPGTLPAAVPPAPGTPPTAAPYATSTPSLTSTTSATSAASVPSVAPENAPFLLALHAPTTSLALPVPRVDPHDPNAGFLAGLLASAPAELISALRSAPGDSVELQLRELRARLEMGELPTAAQTLLELEASYPDDWRVVWYRGVAALTSGDHETAALSFDAIYDAFPGEAAPKLALAVCAEVLGQLDNAAEYYRLVWLTDPSYVSAAFGLARVQLAAGDRPAAVRTLESVPEASIHYTAARVASVRARLRRRAAHEPLIDDLLASAAQVEALQDLGLDAVRRAQLATEVLGTALDWVLSGGHGARPVQTALLGSQLDERGLRFGLERSYRVLARLAQRGDERIDLVERANRLRPRTWV